MPVANATQDTHGKSFDPYRGAEKTVETLVTAYKKTLYRDTPYEVRKDPEALHAFRNRLEADLQRTARGLFKHIAAFPAEGQAVLLKHAHQSAPVGDEKLQRHLLQKLHKVLKKVQDQTLKTQISEWLNMQENPDMHKNKTLDVFRKNPFTVRATVHFAAAHTGTHAEMPRKPESRARSNQDHILSTTQKDLTALMADYKEAYQNAQNTQLIEADIIDTIQTAPLDAQPVLIAALYRDAYAHSALEKQALGMMLTLLPSLTDIEIRQSTQNWLETRIRPYEDLTNRYKALSGGAPLNNVPDRQPCQPMLPNKNISFLTF